MQLGKDECGNFKKYSYDESSCREGMIDYIIRAEKPFNYKTRENFKFK